MKPADKIKELIIKSDVQTEPETDKRILADALQHLKKLKQQKSAKVQPNMWRIIMKSNMTKLAAAAVIIIATFFGINQFFRGTVTFAEVIKPIFNARTVVFDFVMGKDETGPVGHDIVVGNRIRRTFSLTSDTIMIIDLDNAKMLSLDPKSKGAMYIDIQGLFQEGSKNIIGIVRNIVNDIEEHPDWPVQELGQQEIDGRMAIGFLVRGQNQEITIWANPDTAKPVRIELIFGQISAIIKNIEFDVPVDESLVSMEPPAGYTLASMEYNMNQFTEDDFVQSLRIWAEVLDGRFPENLSPEDYLKIVPLLGEKHKQSELSKEEGARIGMTFGRGLMFYQVTLVVGCDWHYVGRGIKLGDAETAVFWYQPKDSPTYRVIYGDLHVEDIAPDKLPK